MILATPYAPDLHSSESARYCCTSHIDDARALGRAVVDEAQPGPALDIGCGDGAVSLAVLAARPDIRVTGVDVSAAACHAARVRAFAGGLEHRFRVVTGDALEIELPDVPTVFANPPLLPTEPGFTRLVPHGRRPPLWAELMLRASGWEHPFVMWLHVFDFHGIERRTGPYPPLAEVADALGFDMHLVHRGMRRVGEGSAIAQAMPSLRRLYPEAEAVIRGRATRFVDVPAMPWGEFAIPHSIVRLSRSAAGERQHSRPDVGRPEAMQ